MIRHECLELLAGRMTDQLVVTSQSGQRIEWSHLSKHEGNLLIGMMGTATAGNTDLEAMARGAGIKKTSTIRDIETFKKEGLGALAQNELAFIVCKVEESLMHREIPRPNTDLAENKYTFVRYLERTEGKSVPFIGRG